MTRLPFEHFDPVDVALDLAGAVGQGQSVEYGLVIAFEPGNEGAQVRLVVGTDLGDPGVQLLAVPAGEDLGERGDVPGQGVQVRAVGPHAVEAGLLRFVQGGGVAQDPAGEVADFGWGRDRQVAQRRPRAGRVDRMPKSPWLRQVPQQAQRLPARPGLTCRGPSHQNRDHAAARCRCLHYFCQRPIVLTRHVRRQHRQIAWWVVRLHRPVHLHGERIGHLTQRPPRDQPDRLHPQRASRIIASPRPGLRLAGGALPFGIGEHGGVPCDGVQGADYACGEGLAADLRQQRRVLSFKASDQGAYLVVVVVGQRLGKPGRIRTCGGQGQADGVAGPRRVGLRRIRQPYGQQLLQGRLDLVAVQDPCQPVLCLRGKIRLVRQRSAQAEGLKPASGCKTSSDLRTPATALLIWRPTTAIALTRAPVTTSPGMISIVLLPHGKRPVPELSETERVPFIRQL